MSTRRESNTSNRDERSVGRRQKRNYSNDDRKPRESLKRKHTPTAEHNKKKRTKRRGRQRYHPLGPGGVAWVYPGTNEPVKAGDRAHFKVKGKAGQDLRVGEIELRVMINNTPQVKVCWFYKPEQIPKGRQKYHSVAELMASFDHALVKLDSIVEKVNVYDNVESYYEGASSRGPCDYFYRFFYNHETRECVPMDTDTEMELHCVCQTIYNPDLFMVECTTCKRWYHSECLSIPESTARSLTYKCPSCASSYTSHGESLNNEV